MLQLIALHSFRRGTGKSSIAANLALLLAEAGARVALIDANLQAPGLSLLFGLDEWGCSCTLHRHLAGECRISQAVYDLSDRLEQPTDGRLFLIPGSGSAADIVRLTREGYSDEWLERGVDELSLTLRPDLLLLDTQPGLTEETLHSLMLADTLALVLRPDQQDYQGTAVTVELARRLEIPRILLIVNHLSTRYDANGVRRQIQEVYRGEVAGVLYHADQPLASAGGELLTRRRRHHPLVVELGRIAGALLKRSE